MVDLEGLLEEVSSFWGDITGDSWPCRARANLLNVGKQLVVATRHKWKRPTLKIACICENSGNGCWPVSISIMRQPRLQISALLVYAVCLTTSGAIQNTEPCRDGRWFLGRATHTNTLATSTQVGEVKLARTVFDLFRDAKVGKLDTALVVDENVRTLDVTVDDRLPMEVLQAAQNLSNPVNSERLFKGTIVLQQGRNGATGDVFEEDIQIVFVDGRVCKARSE